MAIYCRKSRLSIRAQALSAFAAIDTFAPGMGFDKYSPSVPVNHAMGYGLLASAASALRLADEAEHASRWLVLNDSPRAGVCGWGLPFEWDAFQNGQLNSADTVYGITTALCVNGLLDAFELLGVSQYLDHATRALEYYSQFRYSGPDGYCFYYSDQAPDRYRVHNVSMMLAGQYARLGHLTGRADFLEVAVQCANFSLTELKHCRNGDYWNYAVEFPRPNDLVHAAYSVFGLLLVQKHANRNVELGATLSYLRKFLRAGKLYEYVRHRELDPMLLPIKARAWGRECSCGFRVCQVMKPWQKAFEVHYRDIVTVPQGTTWKQRRSRSRCGITCI